VDQFKVTLVYNKVEDSLGYIRLYQKKKKKQKNKIRQKTKPNKKTCDAALCPHVNGVGAGV
jgi:hypothetical protein